MIYFSIIVPCHNSAEYIVRLLEHMCVQGIPREEYEIILMDDNSNEPFMYLVEPFMQRLNIEYHQTKPRAIHCPGNTRLDGLQYAKGEWIAFCDHDDYYCENTLKKIKDFSKGKQNNIFIMSGITSWNEEEQCASLEKIINDIAWLHGKFYNRKNLIEKYGIQFKENFYTHEDIYFNSCVYAELLNCIKDWDEDRFILDEVTYHWVENPKSITRSYCLDNGKDYLDNHLDDYIVASTEPYIKKIESGEANETHYRMLITTLLHAYFYWQSEVYRLGGEIALPNKKLLIEYRDMVCKLLKCSKVDLLNICHSDPFLYEEIREDSKLSRKAFVETTSLKDFILNM